METTTSEGRSILDAPFKLLIKWDWEKAVYVALIIIAAIARFWDVGNRALSHDDSLHALYSWKLYNGEGYTHDPMMHGPFMYHFNALIYFLFGASDATTRFSVALFGVIVVALCYALRRWIGKAGALSAAVMLAISPVVLHYSRHLRHDLLIAVWELLLIIACFRYLESRQPRWLYVAAGALSLSFATKEVSFIYGAIIGSFFALLALWQWLFRKQKLRELPAFELTVLLLTLALPLASPFVTKLFGWNPLDYSPAGYLRSGVIWLVFQLIAVALGLWLLGRRWAVSAGVFYVIFILLFTTFFTNGKGFATGMVGSLGYWLGQQKVERAGQPWFYYFLIVGLYEFLPCFLSLVGVGYYAVVGRRRKPDDVGEKGKGKEKSALRTPHSAIPFVPFLIWWFFLTWIGYTVAGEKMPWLMVHFALPMSILGGWLVGRVIEGADWRRLRQSGALWLMLLFPLLIFAVVSLYRTRPFQGNTIGALSDTMQWIFALVIGLGLITLIYRIVARSSLRAALRAGFLTLAALLTFWTVSVTWRANYINFASANEMLFYAHGSQDVKLALAEIDEISQRTVGDKQIKIAYDDDSTWPLEWYMREYPNAVFYGANPTSEALDAPVVVVGSKNEAKARPYLGDKYYRRVYRLVWWPVEDYKSLTWQKLWEGIKDPAARQRFWDVVWKRKYRYSLSEWPHRHNFYLYVRKDVAAQMWDRGAAPIAVSVEAYVEPYAQGKREVPALRLFGTQGTAAGQFSNPRNVAVGPDGHLYVADTGNHRIQVFDAEGDFLRQWGSQGSAEGQFNEPWGVAVDAQGTVFVADTWNHRIQVFDGEGNFLRQWGFFATADGQLGQQGGFWGPRGIAVDGEGNLYVTDTGNKRVQKFDAQGNFLGQWGGGGIIEGRFDEPVGIAVGPQGNVYVADTWNRRVQKFDRDFNFLKEWPVEGWLGESVVNKPYLAVDAAGTVYVSDPEGYRILVFDGEGNFQATFGQYGNDAQSFALPTGLAVDSDGRLWVADADNHRVMLFPSV
ncbi:MAG: TIGR03663 family protein, partial [Chloroflexi bacterium]|nr:TIGR03663 family protein [Chloroflexota bacterium]